MNLWVENGKSVDPDAPASVLVLDGVVKQHAEQDHHQLGHSLFLVTAWIHVRHREQPVLPDRHLQHRPDNQTSQTSLFHCDICKPTSCLYHLIPPQRDISVITRLRHSTPLPKPSLRTKNYCSSINYALHHYQQSPSIILFVLFDCWFLFIILLCIGYPALQPQYC